MSRAAGIYSTSRSLLDMVSQQDKSKHRPDFCGRSSENSVVKLYPNLKQEDWTPRGEVEVE